MLITHASILQVFPTNTAGNMFLNFFTLTYFTNSFLLLFFLKILSIYFQREEKGRRKEGEKHQCVVAYYTPPTGDLAPNPGTHPDRELNQRPLASQSCSQSTELTSQGSFLFLVEFAPGLWARELLIKLKE